MNKKILIVEDDISISESLKELLTYEGYTVIQAFNGQEALDCLRSGCHPDLILLDLMMPILDGIGFRCEQMKSALFSQIPVIILSADGNIKSKAEMVNVSNYISKPVDIDHLIDVVNSI
jgi:DNA-binding response OmpR family regulator